MEQVYAFGRGDWKSIEEGNEREWLLGNGLGGYANHSIIGGGYRLYHGYLTAAEVAPVKRYLVFTRTQEQITIGDRAYDLTSQEYANKPSKHGQHYLQRFTFAHIPTYHYQVEDIRIHKTIALDYGHNTAVVCYDIQNGQEASSLNVVPLFNYRSAGEHSSRSDLQFDLRQQDRLLELVPHQNKDMNIQFFASHGTFVSRAEQGEDALYEEEHSYRFDNRTGFKGTDSHFTPYDIRIELAPNEHATFYFVCTTETLPEVNGFDIARAYQKRMRELVEQAGYEDVFARHLVAAADPFIVDRQSTGLKTILAGFPWFTDWGRDTMIAFQGLTLATKRFAEAREILESFSKYEQNGLIPNMFPDANTEPLYNTVDASMWYFHSVDQYLAYTGAEEDYAFIRERIYPTLKKIIRAYREGTAFSIQMDEDGLIMAGDGLDQVTWMDVRVDDWVVTPRHGKPVEISALWYNALCVMAGLAERFGEDSGEYRDLAARVHQSFNEKFWNTETQCLYDVIDENDGKIRPNQIWAVSLPHTMLPREKEKQVVQAVYKHLYATYGLRSLSFMDEAYKPIYLGELMDRDAAYHMGTTWAFPLGGFITAYCKVHDYAEEAVQTAREMCAVFEDHLRDGCINGIAEIFDGDFSSVSRGCYSQAWSVGEILRAYVEDVLPHLQPHSHMKTGR
ncbi:amylo-alpha-1,6-glucosidase [Marinicrinis sediminis]|uniref:Amylo-alpha-1,6-glucosidase n=1 Tax=Marinicrinis sediminis TaxID=1652465 RepID=A0ABW5R6F2_9BACL